MARYEPYSEYTDSEGFVYSVGKLDKLQESVWGTGEIIKSPPKKRGTRKTKTKDPVIDKKGNRLPDGRDYCRFFVKTGFRLGLIGGVAWTLYHKDGGFGVLMGASMGTFLGAALGVSCLDDETIELEPGSIVSTRHFGKDLAEVVCEGEYFSNGTQKTYVLRGEDPNIQGKEKIIEVQRRALYWKEGMLEIKDDDGWNGLITHNKVHSPRALKRYEEYLNGKQEAPNCVQEHYNIEKMLLKDETSREKATTDYIIEKMLFSE